MNLSYAICGSKSSYRNDVDDLPIHHISLSTNKFNERSHIGPETRVASRVATATATAADIINNT